MGGKPHQGDVQMADGDAQGGQQAGALPANAAPSGRIPVPRSAVRLPLEVSTHLECKWRDGKFYPARIIERRKADGGAPDEYEYYVHYRKCERGPVVWLWCGVGGAGCAGWLGWLGSRGCGATWVGFRIDLRRGRPAGAPPCARAFALASTHCPRTHPCLPAPAPAPGAVNRRMDEWVPLANFNLDTVCPPEPPEPGEGGRTRNQKRKVDDDHRWGWGGGGEGVKEGCGRGVQAQGVLGCCSGLEGGAWAAPGWAAGASI